MNINNILQMNRAGLLALDPKAVNGLLTAEEVIHMATVLGAFWVYDYDAAGKGRVGLHALLRSLLHSNGFFISRIFLDNLNIRRIIARQMVMRLQIAGLPVDIDYVAGIPDSATALGESVGEILGVPVASMRKVDGRMTLAGEIRDGANVLLVEDFCTRGTGFTEAVLEVKGKNPHVNFAPYYPVIINRSDMRKLSIAGYGDFKIVAVVEKKIQDWDSGVCPLCKMGSKPIKPKTPEENWQLLMTSQFAQTSLE
ncbi:MAG: hypothetical protein Q7K44_03030 [Candidatus Liptonbacteria bacterium]|nr:hypothetical protein [Candidatus Liptonbacteria bacterium]